MFVLQLVVGVGYDGLRTAVQQPLNAAAIVPPSGGTEEVQAEAPQRFLRQTLQQRSNVADGEGRTAEQRLQDRAAGTVTSV